MLKLVKHAPRPTSEHLSSDPLDDIQIGDWYWVKEDGEDDPELFCVTDIGSNCVHFRRERENGNSWMRVHFDEFEDYCTHEPNWEAIFQNRIAEIKTEIKQATAELIAEGKKLSLITRQSHEQTDNPSMLPAVATRAPEQYKADLVAFKEDKMPAIQKRIEELSTEYAVLNKQIALPDLVRLTAVKKSLSTVEDRIFNVELYCGLLETVKQIASGAPAPMDEPVCIRQQLLYMDEETLFDYDTGGMDFERLGDFDRWVVAPGTRSRILPEPKGVVAFRVRRKDKQYDTPRDLLEMWGQIYKHMANRQTYLLIRNGENVYRIATEIDFSPRLIPFQDEIGEKQFLKFSRFNREKEPEVITPDSVYFDDHVAKMDRLIKQYNRIFIFIQGLLDRTPVFHPHPGIRLFEPGQIDLWVRCIRDEETALPNETISWEAYRDQLNKTVRKGNWVWSQWYPDGYGEYRNGYKHFNVLEQEVVGRPRLCEVVSVKRDRSQVKIRWETDRWGYGYWDLDEWQPGGYDKKPRYLWVPIEEVFNVSAYTPGDYKLFLCDRALQGRYLEWAAPLLAAEKHAAKLR
jgi:hypothetical protein